METEDMKKNVRVSEEQLREGLAKKIEGLSTEKTRELYHSVVAPADMYIDDHGYVCFDEKGLKWSMKDEGWTAYVDNRSIYCTKEITAPTIVQRLEAHERATALTQEKVAAPEPEKAPAEVLKEAVQAEDAPSSEVPAAFFSHAGERKEEWSPRRELQDFARLCTPQQLEQFTQDVLEVPYCSKVGKEYLVVRAPIDDQQQGRRTTRSALSREIQQAMDQISMDRFAQLCSEALGKDCVHVGEGNFMVRDNAAAPDGPSGIGR